MFAVTTAERRLFGFDIGDWSVICLRPSADFAANFVDLTSAWVLRFR
jgi:hypothetical protein